MHVGLIIVHSSTSGGSIRAPSTLRITAIARRWLIDSLSC